MSDLSNFTEYREPTKEEHNKIVRFLKKQHFLERIKKKTSYSKENNTIELKEYERNILPKYLEQVFNSFNVEFRIICKNIGGKDKSTTNISRLTIVLNSYLKELCEEENINPLIQLFFYHKNSFGKVVRIFNCHLACAEIGKQKNNRRYSYNIVPFEEPKEYTSPKITAHKADSDDSLNLRQTVLEIPPHIQNCNYFRYEYQFPKKILGRDTELKRLEKFVNYPDKKPLWWIISGKAGSGKSRLALELCVSLKKQGWYAGFLSDTILLHKWQQPSKPTLIVLDYTDDNAEKLGKHILEIFDKHKNWKYPVRILFLTRYEDNYNINRFSQQHPEIIGRILRYNKLANVDETDSLVLGDLSNPSYIDAIILEIFNTIYGKKPTSNDIQAIKQFLQKEVHCNIPLYIMFIADACARSGNIRDWDKEILLNEHIIHNTTIWKSSGIDPNNTLDRKHINLLILSTIANGVNIHDTEYSQCLASHINHPIKPKDILPEKHEFYEDKYQILCDNPDKVNQAPILPDILGEYYFLQNWKGSSAQVSQIELLTLIAWNYSSRTTADFLTRFYQDFPERDILDKVIALLAKIPGKTTDKANDLYNISLICCKVNMPGKAEEFFRQLTKLWENGNQYDYDISLIYAQAAFNISKCYGAREYAEQQCDKAIKYCEYIERLWSNFHKDDLEISYTLAMTEYNFMYFLFNFSNFDNMRYRYDILKKLWLTGSPKDERIKRLIVQALVLLIWYCAEEKNSEAIKFFQEFESIISEYDSNSRERNIERLNALLNLTLYYGNIGRPDEAKDYFDQIDGFSKTSIDNTYYLFILAKAYSNMIYYYINVGQNEKAEEYFTQLEKIYKKNYQDNEDILLSLAKAMVSLCKCFKNSSKKKFIFYTERFNILRKKFPDNQEFNEVCKLANMNSTFSGMIKPA